MNFDRILIIYIATILTGMILDRIRELYREWRMEQFGKQWAKQFNERQKRNHTPMILSNGMSIRPINKNDVVDDDDLLRISEVAKMLGVSVSQVIHYEDQGLVTPVMRTIGNHRRYKRSDVVDLVEKLKRDDA